MRCLLCSPYSLVAVVEDSLISKTQDISDRTVYGDEAEQERRAIRCAIEIAYSLGRFRAAECHGLALLIELYGSYHYTAFGAHF